MRFVQASLIALVASLAPLTAHAQAADAPAPASCKPSGFPPIATYPSIVQEASGKVRVQHCKPEADSVALKGDFPGMPMGVPNGVPMVRDATGMWSLELPAAVPPGRYGYSLVIDGVETFDPRATGWSIGWTGISAIAEIEGDGSSPWRWDATVPHGAVSQISYWSEALGLRRTAKIYTPPGYMAGGDTRYPVLYLVHGAGGSPDSWTSQGAANLILDNLIAQGKAEPMIVVMPNGHVPLKTGDANVDTNDFGDDLHQALIPYVDSHFRTLADADHRAMAGLSMGGRHTIYNGLPRSDAFQAIGIFSMGIGYSFDANGLGPDDAQTRAYVEAKRDGLKQSGEDMGLVYFAMGKDDILHFTAAPLLGVMDEFGIDHIYNDSEGGHDWINWRDYLVDFAPRLFRNDGETAE